MRYISTMGTSGLRERKKARTREAILREAFRLFRERGYNATTIDQIAEAAEISPATFFRYFPTKEDLVTFDRFPPLIEALQVQPPGEPVAVLRGAFRTAFASLTAEEIAAGHAREVFAATVPELLAANLRRSPGLLRELSEIVADRVGCGADDPGSATSPAPSSGSWRWSGCNGRRTPTWTGPPRSTGHSPTWSPA
ncbi:TetR/AcrR family transcriptional regulator [Nonomuraea recticatena]|uniref:TetR/AcrR family transcriptional regulator n=1 Tax=Nonomuraea recticatena TaxID=46178 RepID=UPI003619A718